MDFGRPHPRTSPRLEVIIAVVVLAHAAVIVGLSLQAQSRTLAQAMGPAVIQARLIAPMATKPSPPSVFQAPAHTTPPAMRGFAGAASWADGAPPLPTSLSPASAPTGANPQTDAPAELLPIANTVPSNAAANQTAAAPVVLPSADAQYLNNPPPAYPRMSRRLGEQGTVIVRALINSEGRAERAEIRHSSGHARLDEAALETVKRWRFVPGQRAGVAEAMWFNLPIRFVLD